MANKIESKVAEVKHTFKMTQQGDIFKRRNEIYIRNGDDYNDTAVCLGDGEEITFDDDDEIVFLSEVTITRE